MSMNTSCLVKSSTLKPTLESKNDGKQDGKSASTAPVQHFPTSNNEKLVQCRNLARPRYEDIKNLLQAVISTKYFAAPAK